MRSGTLLVVQWLTISNSGKNLPIQETLVRSLVLEDPTCHRATKPEYHNYQAHAPESLCSTKRETHTPQLESIPHLSQLEKRTCRNKDPEQPKLSYLFTKDQVILDKGNPETQ